MPGRSILGWNFTNLEIGDNSTIAQEAKFDLTDKIIIGKNCAIGASIYTHQDPGSSSLSRYSRKVAPVIINDNVWLGARSVILCGVEIGENSVVAAGSIVISDVPPNTLVAGSPAKMIKHFDDVV